eukprot:scaffold158678_cov19-Tisochrysis_lutea.AAC.1
MEDIPEEEPKVAIEPGVEAVLPDAQVEQAQVEQIYLRLPTSAALRTTLGWFQAEKVCGIRKLENMPKGKVTGARH